MGCVLAAGSCRFPCPSFEWIVIGSLVGRHVADFFPVWDVELARVDLGLTPVGSRSLVSGSFPQAGSRDPKRLDNPNLNKHASGGHKAPARAWEKAVQEHSHGTPMSLKILSVCNIRHC